MTRRVTALQDDARIAIEWLAKEDKMNTQQNGSERRYPLGSEEFGFSFATREQLVRLRAAIDRVLGDDAKEPFLPKPKAPVHRDSDRTCHLCADSACGETQPACE